MQCNGKPRSLTKVITNTDFGLADVSLEGGVLARVLYTYAYSTCMWFFTRFYVRSPQLEPESLTTSLWLLSVHTHLWSWSQKTPSTARIWRVFLLLCGIAWGFPHCHSRPWETFHPRNSQTSFPPEHQGHLEHWSRTGNQIKSRLSEVKWVKSLCKEYQNNMALFTWPVPLILTVGVVLTMAEMTRTTLTGFPLPEGGTSLLSSTNRQASRIPSSNCERETISFGAMVLNSQILVQK